MSEQENQLSMIHVQYEGTPKGSIFGPGEIPVSELLKNDPPLGNWLNLGAGDGRYSETILSTCQQMTAFDIDPRALAKLERDIDPQLTRKLILQEGDLTKQFPYPDGAFDGTFCAATIHIFPEPMMENIVKEMCRVTRKGGRVVVDFLCDIRRVMMNGELYIYPGEISYSKETASLFIERCFAGKNPTVLEDRVSDDFETDNGVAIYVFNSKILLVNCIQ